MADIKKHIIDGVQIAEEIAYDSKDELIRAITNGGYPNPYHVVVNTENGSMIIGLSGLEIAELVCNAVKAPKRSGTFFDNAVDLAEFVKYGISSLK